MKHLSLLFAIYLSMLTIAPVLSIGCSQNTEMCSSNCPEKNSKDEVGNCPFGICCSNCLFFHSEQQQLDIIKIPSATKKIRSTDERVYSNYFAEAWHPPEIV